MVPFPPYFIMLNIFVGYDFVEEINCNGKDPLNIGALAFI